MFNTGVTSILLGLLVNCQVLRGADDGGGASPVGQRNLLQWAAGLRRRRRRLFVRKAEVAA